MNSTGGLNYSSMSFTRSSVQSKSRIISLGDELSTTVQLTIDGLAPRLDFSNGINVETAAQLFGPIRGHLAEQIVAQRVVIIRVKFTTLLRGTAQIEFLQGENEALEGDSGQRSSPGHSTLGIRGSDLNARPSGKACRHCPHRTDKSRRLLKPGL